MRLVRPVVTVGCGSDGDNEIVSDVLDSVYIPSDRPTTLQAAFGTLVNYAIDSLDRIEESNIL